MGTVRHARRLLSLTGALTVCVAGAIAGFIWWEERPLTTAERFLDEGDPESAARILNRFLAEHPQHGRALALRARLLVATGQPSQALELFDRVGAATEKDMHAWAHALLHVQRWSGALPVLEHLLEQDRDNPDVLHEITACRMKLGDSEAALESAKTFAKLPGSEARGYLLIGTIHYEMSNEESAVEAWGRVLQHDPNAENLQVTPDEFFFQYGDSLLKSGRPEKALEALQRCIEISPSADAWVRSGTAHLQLGQPERALESWMRAVELDPVNVSAREGLARVALERGDAEAALDLLQPVAFQPDIRSSTLYLMERACTLLGDEDRAASWRDRKETLRKRERVEALADQVLIESPDSFWAQVIRAHHFASAGNWEQAETLSKTLLKDSADPFVRDLASAIERRSGLPPLEQLPFPQHF